jgi:hypothetical protein
MRSQLHTADADSKPIFETLNPLGSLGGAGVVEAGRAGKERRLREGVGVSLCNPGAGAHPLLQCPVPRVVHPARMGVVCVCTL